MAEAEEQNIIAEREKLEKIEQGRLDRIPQQERFDRISEQERLERIAEKDKKFELEKLRLGIPAETSSVGSNFFNIEQPREKRINLKDLLPVSIRRI